MADDRDQYGPPPGLTPEQRRDWERWRRFIWMDGDLTIIRKGTGKRSKKGDDGKQGDRGAGRRWDPEDRG